MATPKGKVITGKKPYAGATLNRPMKMRKMIQPRCDEHFPSDGTISPFSKWVEGCQAAGHDPYTHEYTVEIRKPVLEERDGKTFRTGETIEVEYRREPNWEQVPDELGIYSGRGVANSIARHFVFPEDLGYAPFCDYRGCGEQNPKFHTQFGNYHTRDEAAIMTLRLRMDANNATTAAFNANTDGARLRHQLDDVAAKAGI